MAKATRGHECVPRGDRMEHEAVGMMRIEMDTLSVLTVNKAYEKLWTKCNLLTHSFTDSFSQSHTQSLIDLLTHSLTDFLNQSLTHSLIHWFFY